MAKILLMIMVDNNKTMYRRDGSDVRREKDLLKLSVLTRYEALSYGRKRC